MFNQEILNNFTVQAAVVIPIITAVVQVFKFWVTDKFTPFISLLVGVGITFLLTHDALHDLSGTILLGILFGLASSGLYSGIQHSSAMIAQERAKKAAKQNKNKQQETTVEKETVTKVEKMKK